MSEAGMSEMARDLRESSRMLGFAPLNETFRWADVLEGRFLKSMTRCRYATLARMARAGGDLRFRDVPKRLRARLVALCRAGYIRLGPPKTYRWELTAKGWQTLRECEEARLNAKFEADHQYPYGVEQFVEQFEEA